MSGGLTTTTRIGEVNLTSLARQRKLLAKQGLESELKTCNGNVPGGHHHYHAVSSTFSDGHAQQQQASTVGRRKHDDHCAVKVRSLNMLGGMVRRELQRCREGLGQEGDQLQRLEAVPAQVLKRALSKAGIPQDRSQQIIDENIDFINSSKRQPRLVKHVNASIIPTRMNNKLNVHTRSANNNTNKQANVKAKSITETILELYPTTATNINSATTEPPLHNNKNHNTCATSLHISECCTDYSRRHEDAHDAQSASRSRGRVTRGEDITPIVFHRIPASSMPESLLAAAPLPGYEHNWQGPDLCAGSISSPRHGATGRTKVRVNKAAVLRQKHAAQRAQQFEIEKKRSNSNHASTRVHKASWSNAAIVREPYSDDNDEEEEEGITSCLQQHQQHHHHQQQQHRVGKASSRFAQGRPWALSPAFTSGSSAASQPGGVGGMFFEVTGSPTREPTGRNNDNNKKNDGSSGPMTTPCSSGSKDLISTSMMSVPREHSEVFYTSRDRDHDRGGGSSWSVDAARSRYGDSSGYD
jgi:hypothetical protein